MRVLQTCSDAFAAAALGEGQADQREGTFILLLALLVQKYKMCSDARIRSGGGRRRVQPAGTVLTLLALLVQKYMQDEASSNLSTLR